MRRAPLRPRARRLVLLLRGGALPACLPTAATCLATPLPFAAAGKDVLQRVGSKGPAADLTRVLVARLTPSLLSPEVLHAAMEEAEQSQKGACGAGGWGLPVPG